MAELSKDSLLNLRVSLQINASQTLTSADAYARVALTLTSP